MNESQDKSDEEHSEGYQPTARVWKAMSADSVQKERKEITQMESLQDTAKGSTSVLSALAQAKASQIVAYNESEAAKAQNNGFRGKLRANTAAQGFMF
jgi:hypothetical protein